MPGARRGPWWLPRASRATPQTPLSLPTLRDRADFPSCGVVASSLGIYPTSSAPPCLRGNLPRSRPREILRQAPSLIASGQARAGPPPLPQALEDRVEAQGAEYDDPGGQRPGRKTPVDSLINAGDARPLVPPQCL